MPGLDFDDLPETYVIFITENDIMGGDVPIYHVDRVVKETGKSFGDEAHIIYVNGAYRGESPIGQLMHDFSLASIGNNTGIGISLGIMFIILSLVFRYGAECKSDISN